MRHYMASGMRRALNGRARRDQHAAHEWRSRQALCSPPAALPSILEAAEDVIVNERYSQGCEGSMRMGMITVRKRVGRTVIHGRNKPANVMVHGGSCTRRADPRRRAHPARFVECVVCLKRDFFHAKVNRPARDS